MKTSRFILVTAFAAALFVLSGVLLRQTAMSSLPDPFGSSMSVAASALAAGVGAAFLFAAIWLASVSLFKSGRVALSVIPAPLLAPMSIWLGLFPVPRWLFGTAILTSVIAVLPILALISDRSKRPQPTEVEFGVGSLLLLAATIGVLVVVWWMVHAWSERTPPMSFKAGAELLAFLTVFMVGAATGVAERMRWAGFALLALLAAALLLPVYLYRVVGAPETYPLATVFWREEFSVESLLVLAGGLSSLWLSLAWARLAIRASRRPAAGDALDETNVTKQTS